jgi:hypothetical protein
MDGINIGANIGAGGVAAPRVKGIRVDLKAPDGRGTATPGSTPLEDALVREDAFAEESAV